MPLFEFRCCDCEDAFETIVSSGDRVQCPECDGENLEKLLSTFAVRGGSSASSRRQVIPAGGT